MAALGLVCGMALGFAAWFGGFAAFLLVAALGAVGFGLGRLADGDLDLDRLTRTPERRP